MTLENDNQESNDVNLDKTSDNSEDNSQGGTKKESNVPLDTFLAKKKELKEVKTKLAEFEAKEIKLAEDKLLEEKNFQELIQKKQKELEEATSLLDIEKKNNKLEKLRNKISNSLSKKNAIDSEDVLKFIDVDKFLDSEDLDSDIAAKIDDLIKSKSYLFKSVVNREHNENGKPSSNVSENVNNQYKIDPTISSLAQKFNKI